MGITSFILVFLVIKFLMYWWQPIQRWKYRKLPGYRFSILSPIQRATYATLDTNIDSGISIVDKYPKLCAKVGTHNEIILTDPKLFKQVGSQFPDKTDEFSYLGDGTGLGCGFSSESIVQAGGKKWQDLRNAFNPAFTMGTVRSYEDTIQNCIKDHINRLDKFYGENKQFDIRRFTESITIQILLKAAFGAQLDINNKEYEQDILTLSQATFDMQSSFLTSQAFMAVLLTPKFMHYFFRYIPYVVKLFNSVNKNLLGPGVASYNILTHKFNQNFGLNSNGYKTEKSPFSYDEEKDFMKSETSSVSSLQNFQDWQNYKGPGLFKMLMEKALIDGKPMAYQDLVIQLSIMIFGGFGTTSITLVYVFFEIVCNPQCKQKVFEEIDRFGQENPKIEDIQKFPYIRACVNETLRRHPILKNFSRKCTQEDYKLAGYSIPKGSNFIFPMRGVHLSSKFWPSPFEWRPERWLGDTEYQCKSQTLAFFPFGHGPRYCIGYNLANVEMILTVVNILQKYDLEIIGSKNVDDYSEYVGPGILFVKQPMNYSLKLRQ